MRDETRDLAFLLRSRFPILTVETAEEQRFLALVERAANLENQALFTWSVACGLRRINRPDVFPETHDLVDALKHIYASPQNGTFVFFDACSYLDNPISQRLLREMGMNYSQTPRTMVFVASSISIPADLQRISATFRLALPSLDEIRDLFREEVAFWKSANDGQQVRGEQKALDQMLQQLVGFTVDDARRLIRQSLNDDGAITMEDVARVLRHKHEALGSSGLLTLENPNASFADIGGQVALKRWLSKRYPAFVGEAGTATLTPPKGVLLLGVQGSGKSLAAKSVAGTWQVPLLRLDFGALYNKYHGETERNLREALRAAQAMAPCVLWFDEIEKGLASGESDGDGGVSRRILGAFLTWMSERQERVFIVATANDISRLPPELLRKGRFDEIFFVDLPLPAIRSEILQIHLKKRALDPAQFDLARLSAAGAGFSGAELEQAIIAAQYDAYESKRALDTDMLENEMKSTRPLSVVRSEEVAALREWATERTVGVD